MPVLDGYQAIAALRESERGGTRHIPIVALTANAMAEDRARCLAAGMDDHIGKPVRCTAPRFVAISVSLTAGAYLHIQILAGTKAARGWTEH
jgi:CheY-like chemotaxis protein